VNRQEVPDSTDTTHSTGYIVYQESSVRKEGIMALVGTQIGRFAMLNGGIKIERFQTYNSNESVIRDPLGNFRLGMRYLMVNLLIDNLDRDPFPTSGHQHRITLGGAHDALGGTESFLKLDASMAYYATFFKRNTVCLRLRFGGATNALPDVERFVLGGAMGEERYREMEVYNYIPFVGLQGQPISNEAPQSIPGDILGLLHLDYRFTIVKDFYALAMADCGNTWYHNDFQFSRQFARKEFGELPLGVGLGIAYNSVVGPLQFSWGRLLVEPDRVLYPSIHAQNLLYISLGHDF
jgi:outer membrane protein assembly factor BamA